MSYGKFLILSIGVHYKRVVARQDVVTVYDVLPTLRATNETGKAPQEDRQKKAFTARWLEQDGCFIVVVRPDMYVGLVSTDAAEVDSWIGCW